MKLMIAGNEVEIKVKGEYSEKFNKEDTMAFLCELNCNLYAAENMYKLEHLDGLAKRSRKLVNDIHNELDKRGYYDDVEI